MLLCAFVHGSAVYSGSFDDVFLHYKGVAARPTVNVQPDGFCFGGGGGNSTFLVPGIYTSAAAPSCVLKMCTFCHAWMLCLRLVDSFLALRMAFVVAARTTASLRQVKIWRCVQTASAASWWTHDQRLNLSKSGRGDFAKRRLRFRPLVFKNIKRYSVEEKYFIFLKCVFVFPSLSLQSRTVQSLKQPCVPVRAAALIRRKCCNDLCSLVRMCVLIWLEQLPSHCFQGNYLPVCVCVCVYKR